MASVRWGGLRLEPYNPDAVDADGDGIVQEGTAWERPAGTRLISELGTEIQRGSQSTQRPRMRVVDASGNTIDYKPSYDRSTGRTSTGKKQQSLLGSLGYPSLKERGIRTIGDMVPTLDQIVRPKPKVVDVEGAVFDLRGNISPDKRMPKRGNRDRAFKRADEKAKELTFLQGGHYLVETDSEFFILSADEFDDFFNEVNGPDGLPPGIAVTRYEKPKADLGDQQDIKDGLLGPRQMEIDDEAYRDSVVDIHYNFGNINDLDDDLFVAVMLDEGLEMGGSEMLNPDGSPTTFEDLLSGDTQLDYGETFENRRFSFVQLKSSFLQSDTFGGLWTVFRATDKETGHVWFIKGSTYPTNDAVLEEIGMRVGALLDLAASPNERHIRISPQVEVRRAGLRNVRWTAMRNVKEWDHPDGEILDWEDSHTVGGIDPNSVEVKDVAQILAMDFIFGNSDRHDGNFMVANDSAGRQRLMIIDNGLLAGARMHSERADYAYDVSAREVSERLELEASREPDEILRSTDGNYLIQNPKVKALSDRLGDIDSDGGDFIDTTKQTVEAIKANLDFIFDTRKFSQRGVPLTATERAHLEGLRKVAERRLEMLESNPELLWYEVFEPIPGLVQAPGANTPESEMDVDLPDEIKEIPTNELISEKIKARNKEILDGIREAGGTDFARPTPEFLEEINKGRTRSQRRIQNPDPGEEGGTFAAFPRESVTDAAESRRLRTREYLSALKKIFDEYGDGEPDWDPLFAQRNITEFGVSSGDFAKVRDNPQLEQLIRDTSVDELLDILEEQATEFMSSDIEIRVRTSPERLEGILVDGRYRTIHEVESRLRPDGHKVSAPTEARVLYEERLGVAEGTPPGLRPASGYIVHPDWVTDARERFKLANDDREPTEFDELPLNAGDLDGYGGVEIVLNPGVKGRSAFARGDSFNGQTDPVRFDETDPLAIANALVTGQSVNEEDFNNSVVRMLEASISGDFSDIHLTRGELPMRGGEKLPALHSYIEALIPGGFTVDEIDEIVMPRKVATQFDMEAVSESLSEEFFTTDKLRAMGLSEEEIAYVLRIMSEDKGLRSPIGNVPSAWATRIVKLQEFRAARERRDTLANVGIPMRVTDSDPKGLKGLDIFDPVSYGGNPDDDVEQILADRARKWIVKIVREDMEREATPNEPSDMMFG